MVPRGTMLQWGSETGSRRRFREPRGCHPPRAASMGLRDWVSEKGNNQRRPDPPTDRFNGAPRLGLGEGYMSTDDQTETPALQWGSETGSRRRTHATPHMRRSATLQWGSETGSRRRLWGCPGRPEGQGASMGLRDWVSEKVHRINTPPAHLYRSFNGAPRLGLGEGRRRSP